jgi:hypothetical protein
VVSLRGGERMLKNRYTVTFCSEKNDTLKAAIVKKIQDALKPSIVDGTITATSDAIHVDVVDVGETYPIYEGA